MKLALAIIASLALPTAGEAALPRIPIGLACTVADLVHSNQYPDLITPEASTKPEYIADMNRCILAVQTYASTHCPKSKHTIWQQIEAVAYSGPGIPDKKAIAAACR